MAQYNLGLMYEDGQGVPQDNIQAYVWFNLAAAHMDPGPNRNLAVHNRDRVAKRLTPPPTEPHQDLARTWQPTPGPQLPPPPLVSQDAATETVSAVPRNA